MESQQRNYSGSNILTKRRSYRTSHRGVSTFTQYEGLPYAHHRSNRSYNSSEYPRRQVSGDKEFHSPYYQYASETGCFYSADYNHGYNTGKEMYSRNYSSPATTRSKMNDRPAMSKFSQNENTGIDKEGEFNRSKANYQPFYNPRENVANRTLSSNIRTVVDTLIPVGIRNDYESDDQMEVSHRQVDTIEPNNLISQNNSKHHVTICCNTDYHRNHFERHREIPDYESSQNRKNISVDIKHTSKRQKCVTERNNMIAHTYPQLRYNEKSDNRYNAERESLPEMYGCQGDPSEPTSNKHKQEFWQPWNDKHVKTGGASNEQVRQTCWTFQQPVSTTVDGFRAVPASPFSPHMTFPSQSTATQVTSSTIPHTRPPTNINNVHNRHSDLTVPYKYSNVNKTRDLSGEMDFSFPENVWIHQADQQNAENPSTITQNTRNECNKTVHEVSTWIPSRSVTGSQNLLVKSKYVSEKSELFDLKSSVTNQLPHTKHDLRSKSDESFHNAHGQSDQSVGPGYTTTSKKGENYLKHPSCSPPVSAIVNHKQLNEQVNVKKNELEQCCLTIPVECIPLPPDPVPKIIPSVSLTVTSAPTKCYRQTKTDVLAPYLLKNRIGTEIYSDLTYDPARNKSHKLSVNLATKFKSEHLLTQSKHVPTFSTFNTGAPGVICSSKPSTRENLLNRSSNSNLLEIASNSSVNATLVSDLKGCDAPSVDIIDKSQCEPYKLFKSPEPSHAMVNESNRNSSANHGNGNEPRNDERIVIGGGTTGFYSDSRSEHNIASGFGTSTSNKIYNSNYSDLQKATRNQMPINDDKTVYDDRHKLGKNNSYSSHQAHKRQHNLHRPWQDDSVYNIDNDHSVNYHFNGFINPRGESKIYSSRQDIKAGMNNVKRTEHDFRPWRNHSELERASNHKQTNDLHTDQNTSTTSVVLHPAVSLTDTQSFHRVEASSIRETGSHVDAGISKLKKMTAAINPRVGIEIGSKCSHSINNKRTKYKTSKGKETIVPFTDIIKLAKRNIIGKPVIPKTSSQLRISAPNICTPTKGDKICATRKDAQKVNGGDKNRDLKKIDLHSSSVYRQQTATIKKQLNDIGSSASQIKKKIALHLGVIPLGSKVPLLTKQVNRSKLTLAGINTNTNLKLGTMKHLKEVVTKIRKQVKRLEKPMNIQALLMNRNGNSDSKMLSSQHPKLRHKTINTSVISKRVNINSVDIESLPKPSVVVSRCDAPKMHTIGISAAEAEKMARNSISSYMKRAQSASGSNPDPCSVVKKQKVQFDETGHQLGTHMVEQINFDQTELQPRAKATHTNFTQKVGTNCENATAQENDTERETADRQPCLMKRGRYVLKTPTTFVKLPHKPVQPKKLQISDMLTTDTEKPKHDPLSQGLCSAKKYLLYRALASEALKRNSSKPIAKKAHKSKARISNCSLQIGKEMGDKLLDESSALHTEQRKIGSEIKTISNNQSDDNSNIDRIPSTDGCITNSNAIGAFQYVNAPNAFLTGASIASTLMHKSDTVTISSVMQKPNTTLVSQHLNRPILCSQFAQTNSKLEMKSCSVKANVTFSPDNGSPKLKIDECRNSDSLSQSTVNMNDAADAMVYHIDKRSYVHYEQEEGNDMHMKQSTNGEAASMNTATVVPSGNSTEDTKCSTQTCESLCAHSIHTLQGNEINTKAAHVTTIASSELNVVATEKQRSDLQEKPLDYCSKLVSEPMPHMEPTSISKYSEANSNETTFTQLCPLLLPIVKDFVHLKDTSPIQNSSGSPSDITYPTTQCNVLNSYETTAHYKEDCAGNGGNGRTVEDEHVITAVPNSIGGSHFSDHSCPASCDSDSMVEPFINQEMEASKQKVFNKSMVLNNAKYKRFQKQSIGTVRSSNQASEEVPNGEHDIASVTNMLDMIDGFMKDDNFWTTHPPELEVLQKGNLFRYEGQPNNEDLLLPIHENSEPLFHSLDVKETSSLAVGEPVATVTSVNTDAELSNTETNILKSRQMEPFISVKMPPQIGILKGRHVKRFPQPLPKAKHKTSDQLLYEDAKTFLGNFSDGKRRCARRKIAKITKDSMSGPVGKGIKCATDIETGTMQIVDPITGYLETVCIKSDTGEQKKSQNQLRGTENIRFRTSSFIKMQKSVVVSDTSTRSCINYDQEEKINSPTPTENDRTGSSKQDLTNNTSVEAVSVRCTGKGNMQNAGSWKAQTVKRLSENVNTDNLPIVKVKRVKTMSESDSDVQIVDIGQNATSCKLCSRILKCEMASRRHYVLVHNNWCLHCNKEFPNKEEKRRHFKKMHMISTFCGTCGVATQAGSNFSQHLKSASHMKKLATPNRSTFTVNQSKTIADGRDLGAESGTNAKNTSSSIEGSMNAKSVPRLKIKNKNYSAELNVKSTVTSPGRMKNYCGSPNWKVQKNCSSTNNKALAKSKLKKINGGKTNKAPIVLKKKSAKGQANGKTVKLLKEKNSNSKTPLTSDIESKKLRENGMRTKKVWYCNVCDHSYSRKREHLETIKHKLAVEEASKQGRAEKLAEKLAQTNVGSNNATSIKVVEQIEMSAPLSTVVSEPVQECVMPGLPCRAVSAGPNTMPGVECAHFPGPDMTTYNHGIHGEFKLSPTFLFKNVACRSDGLTDARPLKEERVENGNESPLSGENSETWNNQQYPYQDADAGGEQSTNVTVNSSETDDNIYIYENLNTVRNASISDYSSVADLNETGSMIKYSTDLTLDPSLESERPVPVPDEDDNLEFMQSVMSSRAVTVVTLPSNVNSNA